MAQPSTPSSPDGPAIPYPELPNIVVKLGGDWHTGGIMEFFLDGRRVAFLKLSPAPWTTAAYLFLAAIDSQHSDWLDAFITTNRMIDLLEEHDTVSLPTAQSVHRLVNKIRSQIATLDVLKFTNAKDPALSAKDFAARVLQSCDRIGYRLGVPPQYLRLRIGHTSYDDDGR